MTDQLTALKNLAEQVEAGTATVDDFQVGEFVSVAAWMAFYGSLNDAKLLHDEVLGDEWHWRVYLNKFASVDCGWSGPWLGIVDGNPARAWLLAIIKARIWEIENDR